DYSYSTVPRHGDALLAPPGRGGTGTGGNMTRRCAKDSAPERLCCQARALGQRLELRPDDTRVDVRLAPRLRRETAVSASHHMLPPDGPREADNALSDQLRVLHQIRRVGDDAGNDRLALRQRHGLPDMILVLVTRVRCLERVGPGVHLEHNIDDVLERHIVN